ncbi:beta-glucosidase [Diatrype stigma]|uniref:Beta-glucosidase n=1 Tax=Diatrype stigma TaxID=117547 RepID=A0AAN9UCQ7_9PEZI
MSPVNEIILRLGDIGVGSFDSESERLQLCDALLATLQKVRSPWDIACTHNWVNPTTNAAIKTLIDAGIFKKWTEQGNKPLSTAEFAELTGADPVLLAPALSFVLALERRLHLRGPLVQFILPCVAFCLSIPRGWKIEAPEWIFRSPPGETSGFFLYYFKLLVALVIVCVDTMSWLCVCFAFAGPMMLSAIYEYMLDGKILKYMSWDYTGHMLPLLRARLLLAIVAGNILVMPDGHDQDFDLARSQVWKDVVKVVQRAAIPSNDLNINRQDSHPEETTQPPNGVFTAEGESVVELRAMEVETQHTEYIYDENAPSRLRTLLNSQASFGAAVGAPIIFFVGGFTYNILEAQSREGDNDTAHALAYGMWWMIIPHLAIISCAMLAANSPSILHSLVGDGGRAEAHTGPWRRRLRKVVKCTPRGTGSFQDRLRNLVKGVEDLELIKPAYDGRFETVSLWRRGPNKRLWVNEVIDWHESEARRASQTGVPRDGSPTLRKLLEFGVEDRLWLFFGVLVLVIVPSALAGATSWNTPRTGLSCRSLNHLAYLCAQILQMALWGWDTHLHYGSRDKLQKSVCWMVQFVVGAITVFISIGGTLMQIIGVYRNCLCSVSRLPLCETSECLQLTHM